MEYPPSGDRWWSLSIFDSRYQVTSPFDLFVDQIFKFLTVIENFEIRVILSVLSLCPLQKAPFLEARTLSDSLILHSIRIEPLSNLVLFYPCFGYYPDHFRSYGPLSSPSFCTYCMSDDAIYH